ncbi:hypothetical protein [Rhodophyticola sp. SM2404]
MNWITGFAMVLDYPDWRSCATADFGGRESQFAAPILMRFGAKVEKLASLRGGVTLFRRKNVRNVARKTTLSVAGGDLANHNLLWIARKYRPFAQVALRAAPQNLL